LGIKAPEPLPGEKPQTLDQIGLDAMYNAALASELGRDFRKAVELYTQYGAIEPDRRNEDDYVQSFHDTAAANKKKGRTAAARTAGEATISAWKARGSIKNSRGAK